MNSTATTIFGHLYLLSRPSVYNGGILGQLLSSLVLGVTNSTFNIVLNSSLSIPNYIANFFLASSLQVPSFNNVSISYSYLSLNNLPTSIFGLMFLLFLFLTCVLGGIIWIVLRMTRKPITDAPSRPLELLPNSQISKERNFFLNHVLCLCIFCFIVFLFFLICFSFTIASQVYLQIQMMSTMVPSSFQSTWLQSSSLLNNFFKQMTGQSSLLFNSTLENMGISLTSILLTSLNNLISDLLKTFGVYNVFNSANTLISDLQSVTTSMQYIQDNTNWTLSQVNYQKGYLQATIQTLQYSMGRVCQSLPQNATCLQYLNNSSNFYVVIDTDKINSDSSVTMLFILDQFKLNVTALASDFSTMQATFNSQMTNETNLQVQQLNLGNTLQQLSSIWPFISQMISSWQGNMSSVSGSVSSYLNSYGLAVFLTTSLLMFAVAVLSIFYVLVLVRYGLLYLLRRQIANVIKASSPVNPRSIATYFYRKRKIQQIMQYYKVTEGAIYSYLLIFSCMVGLILVISLAIINFSHLLYNEICVQIWRSEGLMVVDQFLNIFLSNHWNTLVQFLMTVSVPIQFTVPQPIMVLTGLRNNCTSDKGIFYALQMVNFVNVSSFIWNPQIYSSLVNGLNITYVVLVKTNVSQIISQNLTYTLNSATSITTTFDQINYQPSIDQLSKGVIQMKNYSDWTISAIQFFSNINSPDATETLRLLKTLNSDVPALQGLESGVFNLSTKFQVLQNKRNNTANIKNLMNNIDYLVSSLVDSPSTYNIVQTIYNQRMLTELPPKIETSMNNLLGYLFNHIFPCGNLSSSLSLILDNLCSYDGTVERTCSYGLNMAVTCAFMTLMLHLLWNVVRKDMVDIDREEASSC